MTPVHLLILCYFAGISLITAMVTLIDKYKAKKGRWRVPESTLFILAILGGSVAEYGVMRLIRHKTLHKKFMIGLPVIIILQLALIFFILTQLN
ncbi:MAG: DUF1294 domain-containing protein [Clostridia bacterium]|nr:DUF1294 domain-containing protein [Clostridia bacterium]